MRTSVALRPFSCYVSPNTCSQVPAAPVLKRENKKRKVEDYTSATPVGDGNSKHRKTDKKDHTERKSKNTAVYVTGLPPDAEQDEIIERFSKCGVLEEAEDGEPKVKLYAKDDGSFSGDALVVFFKEDSVTLAINLLDEAELRLGQPHTIMKVSKADFAHKNHSSGGEHGGESHPPRKTVDKKKTTKRIGKMQKWGFHFVRHGTRVTEFCLVHHLRKLEEWGDDDGFGPAPDATDQMTFAGKNSRVVVLKHMFTIEDLEEDASLLLDLKEDVREECSTLGEVTNVVLYDVSIQIEVELKSNPLVWFTEGGRRYYDSQVQGSLECPSMRSGK